MTLRGEGLEIPYWSEYIFPPSLAVTCKPCQPGQSVNLSEHDRLAESVYGTINIGGISVFFDRGDLGFDIRAGDVTLGEASTTTFLFLGRLTGVAEGGMAFERTLIGSGTASAFLDPDSEFVGHFQGSTSYDFDQPAPVPEPATLILFGTGLASLTLRLRRGNPHVGHRRP